MRKWASPRRGSRTKDYERRPRLRNQAKNHKRRPRR
jgi:hypothetical protein